MRRTRWARGGLAAMAAVALLVTSACGDDDDDDDAGGGSASGAPIKVMTWTSLENPNYSAPQVKVAAEAAEKAINDAGGVGGRPLDVEFCDTNFDPNVEAACARKAVDEDFVAVVGSTSFFPNTLPLLERGGVAYIGGQGLTPAELSSKIAFPLAGSIPGWFRGAAALALQKGVQRPAIVISEVGASQFGGQQLTEGLKAGGVEPIRTVTAPLGAPDQSAAAAQAADGADAVLLAAAPNDSVKITQSLRQANFTGVIASVTAIFGGDTISSLGAAAEGLLLTSQVAPASNTDNPAVARFNEEMNAIDSRAGKDERSLTTWASIGLVKELVEGIDGEVNADSVLEAINNLSEPIDTGVTAPYVVAGQTSPLEEYPRIINRTVVFTEVRDGKLVQTDPDFVDPYEVLRQIAGG